MEISSDSTLTFKGAEFQGHLNVSDLLFWCQLIVSCVPATNQVSTKSGTKIYFFTPLYGGHSPS